MTIDGPVSLANMSTGPLGDYIPSDLARAWLEDLMIKRQPITVSTEWVRTDGSTGYKAFDNMMIQSISETVSADTGDSATFKVALKQITFVTNDRTVVKVAVPRAKKKLDKGNKPNTDATGKVPRRRTSALVDVTDAASDLFGNLTR